jgi:hypothetical protein
LRIWGIMPIFFGSPAKNGAKEESMNTKKYELALSVVLSNVEAGGNDEALQEPAYDLDQLEAKIRKGAKELAERFARDAVEFDTRMNTCSTSCLVEQQRMVTEMSTRQSCFLHLIKVMVGIEAARSFRQEFTRLVEEEASQTSGSWIQRMGAV